MCELLDENEIQIKTKGLTDKEKKNFDSAIEYIYYIERGRDITYLPINDSMVKLIEGICEEKENYEILQILKNRLKDISSIKLGTVVKFAGSKYTVVKIDRNKNLIDIKQSFSIGLIYEKISIFEVIILN